MIFLQLLRRGYTTIRRKNIRKMQFPRVIQSYMFIAPHQRVRAINTEEESHLFTARDIRVKVLPPPLVGPVTFELLLVKVINCTLGLTIAIIYRPPKTNLSEFINELSDLLDKGSLGSRFLICGDLNCPGPSKSRGLVGKELAELIDGYVILHISQVTF